MSFTASRILDLLLIYYYNWQSKLWSQHYQNLASLRNTLEHLPFCEDEAELTRRIKKSKLDFIKNHDSKLTRDLQHGNQYLPNTYVDTDHNRATLTTSSSTKRHKKKRKPTYKLKRDIIKATKCIDKSVVPQEDVNKAVINLSNKELTSDHIYAFFLDASFALTPNLPNLMKFNDDFIKWINKLRYTYNSSIFFSNLPLSCTDADDASQINKNTTILEKDLIPKSMRPDVETKGTKSPVLEFFIQKIKDDVNSFSHGYKNCIPSNLDKDTLNAIHEMKKWDDIVIRTFDKGSGFFVLDKEDYINRVMNELQDNSTFENIPILEEAVHRCKKDITNWLETYHDEPGMTTKIAKWVYPNEDCVSGNNYINLKAHKPHKPLISASCNGYTNNLASLTVYELRKVDLPYNLNDKLAGKMLNIKHF